MGNGCQLIFCFQKPGGIRAQGVAGLSLRLLCSEHVRKAPLTKSELELARRLRECREAAGFTRSLLATRAGMRSNRIVKYEHELAAIPYHAGARLFAELNVCQRWAVTGAEPKSGYVEVSSVLETIIPKGMTFSEAYRRVLADELEDRLRAVAMSEGVRADQLTPQSFTKVGPLGEHPAARRRRHAYQLISTFMPLVVEACTAAEVERFIEEIVAQGRRLIQKHGSDLEVIGGREKAERDETVRKFSQRLAGWLPPGHARRRKKK